MQSLSRLALAASLSVATMSAQAALEARPGGMVYDTVQNITWLADMNYARTSGQTGTGVNVNGTMTWDAATAWASNLVYGGFSDWRLPTLNPLDASCTGGFGVGFGYNCTGGELSRLFVADLGYNNDGSGLITSDNTALQIANLALFSNVQSDFYWSGTEDAPFPVDAWFFRTDNGAQSVFDKLNASYAVAVRPGDVAAIPEPQTYALLLAGLGAVVVAVRRRRPR